MGAQRAASLVFARHIPRHARRTRDADEIRFSLKAADWQPINEEIYNTIREVPAGSAELLNLRPRIRRAGSLA
jgi:hypothetical protein